MATTFKIAVDKMGATDPYNYIGRKGDIFYDPEFGELRISDGDTPYGAGLQQGIGGSTPTINQVLQVDNIASLEPVFAGGIKVNTVESLEDLLPVYFTSNVEIDSTITANQTNFGTLNGLTIPSGPGTIALLSNIAGSGTVLEAVQDDTAPILGGNLDTSGFVISSPSSSTDGVIIRQADPAGPALTIQDSNLNNVAIFNDQVQLQENTWPAADGTANQILVTDGAGQLSYITRNPFTKFYYYYGGSSPGPVLIPGSDTLGVGIGAWNEMTLANAGTGGDIANLGPSTADYDPNLTGITVSNGVFSGFIQGAKYQITVELQVVNTQTSAAIQTHTVEGSNNYKLKGVIAYPGSGAINNTDPITTTMSGLFIFEDSIASNNTLTINLNQQQILQYYVTECVITIIRIA